MSLNPNHGYIDLYCKGLLYEGHLGVISGWYGKTFSVVGQATAKIRPRPAQGLFSIKRTLKKGLFSFECWLKSGGPTMLSSMGQDVARLQFVSCAEKDSLCGNRHNSWWPELKMFGSMPRCSFVWHKLLRANELLYSSLNLIDEFTSLFSPKVISAGLPRKAVSQKHAFVDISVFVWLYKPAKFCPRPAQGLFSVERTS